MTWALILKDEDGERWNDPLTVADVFQIACRATLVSLGEGDPIAELRKERDAALAESEQLRAVLRAVRDLNAEPIPNCEKEYGAGDPGELLMELAPWLFAWSHTCEMNLRQLNGSASVVQFKRFLCKGERCPRCGESLEEATAAVIATEHQR